jgi:hypothetical protein
MTAMQIIGAEKSSAFQRLDIGNIEFAAFPPDEIPGTELLQRPVDVDGRNPGQLGKFMLRERKLEAVIAHERNIAKPQQQFTEQMRETFERRTLAEADSPFALDRPHDERVPAKRPIDRRMRFGKPIERLPGQPGETRGRQRCQRMIHFLEEEDVGVAEVAGHHQRDDLPPAVLERLVPIGPAVEKKMDELDVIAFADDVLTCSQPADVDIRQGVQRSQILVGKASEILQLEGQRVRHFFTSRSDNAPADRVGPYARVRPEQTDAAVKPITRLNCC